ncbi:MAG: hypothetical protein A2X12_07890 [Bacteroidetes bacterium GWE2_29_8]|nr:MAG: hypothetical protein A2X12_07890 [Bacteroidetes bacterium GWE2_29_8]
MKKLFIITLLLLSFSLFNNNVKAQLIVETNITAEDLIKNYLLGEGVTVSNIQVTGNPTAIGAFDGTNTHINIKKGMLISTGYATNAIGPNNDPSSSQDFQMAGDPLLDNLIYPLSTADAMRIEFDFVATSDSVSFRYAFGSEEYPDYVGMGFSDAFGFFISGPNPFGGTYTNKNLALVPGTSLPVTIDNINSTTNSQYYVPNDTGVSPQAIQYNGYTRVLTAASAIVPCQKYHIILVIGDAGDGSYDSGVFLEAGSFSSSDIKINVNSAHINGAVEGCSNANLTFKLSKPASSNYKIDFAISGTAKNGVDYATIGSSVTIPAGKDSATISINPLTDALTEGTENVIIKFLLSSCSGDSQTVTIPIQDYIAMNLAKTDTTIKSGDSFNMKVSVTGGTTPYTYSWSTNQVTSVPYINVKPTVTTTYHVTVKDFCAKTVTASIIVTVSSACSANAGGDKTICSGNTATLDGSGGGTYTWTPTTSIVSGASTSKPIVNPSVTTTYTLLINNVGCTATDNVVVLVMLSPTANAGSDKTIAANSSTTLTATGGGTYSWNNAVTGATITVSPTQTTTYCVTVTNNGCTASDCVTVTVVTASVNAGIDKTICKGASTTLTATGADTYSWSNNAGTTATVTVNPDVTTTYIVTGTKSGITATDNVIVTVNNLPTVSAGVDKSICKGNSTTITATATNYDSLAWSNGYTTTSITVYPTITTTYKITASNKCGNVTDDVIVNVNNPPLANAGADKTIYKGASTTITATGGTSYYWNNGAGSTATVTVSPSITTTYVVTVTSSAGCTASDAVVVFVQTFNVNAGEDQTICKGSSTLLTATGADTYSWSTKETTANITVSPTVTTTYRVTGTKSGATSSDAVVIVINNSPIANFTVSTECLGSATIFTNTSTKTSSFGIKTYHYLFGDASQSYYLESPTHTYAAPFTYYATLIITDSIGCKDSITKPVIVNAIPPANAGADKTILSGASTTLTATGGNSYYWNNGAGSTATVTVSPTTTTTYKVTVTSNGCTSTDEVVITVQTLTVNAGIDKAICIGNSATLTATGADTYYWNTNATTATITVKPTISTTYKVTGTKNGFTASDEVIVTVNSLPIVELGENQSICNGDVYSIKANGSYNFVWNNGQTGSTLSVKPSINTTYSVIATDVNGCTASDNIVIIVKVKPIVNAGSDITIYKGASTELISTVTNIQDLTNALYSWSNGTSAKNINVNPLTTTTYINTVTVDGCSGSDNVIVTVKDLAITAGENKEICYGNQTLLTASGADYYTWSTLSNSASIQVAPLTTTTYTVTGTKEGATASTSVVVIVNPIPQPNLISDTTITIGDSITITASNGAMYYWNTGQTTASILVKPTINTNYQVTVTDSKGCIGVGNVNVNVKTLFSVSKVIASRVTCGTSQDGYAQVFITGGDAPFTYLWSNGQTTEKATGLDKGTYTISVTDSKGYVAIGNAIITGPGFVPEPVVNTINITNNAVTLKWTIVQNVATYMVRYREIGAISVWKYFNANSVTDSYLVTGLKEDTKYEWQIRAIVDNANYSCFTELLPFQTLTQSVCSTPENLYTNLISTSRTKINWDTDTNAVKYIIRYQVKGSNNWKFVYVDGNVNTFILSSLTQGTTYEWSIRKFCEYGSYSDFATPYIEFTTLSNCTNPINLAETNITSSSTLLNWDAVNGAVYYMVRWKEQGTNDWSYAKPSKNMLQVGCSICNEADMLKPNTTYDWQVRAFCSTDGSTYSNLFVADTFTTKTLRVAISGNGTICLGESTTLIQSSKGKYLWNTGDTTAAINVAPVINTTYTMTVTYLGVSQTDSKAVTVNSGVLINAGADVTICEGDSAKLIVNGAEHYEWSIGSLKDNITVMPLKTFTYIVTAIDGGCTGTDDVIVFVNQRPLVNAGADQYVCEGTNVQLNATGGNTYLWSNGQTNPIINVNPIEITSYTVTADNGNCTASDMVVVVVSQLSATASNDITLCVGEAATISATGGINYEWSNGQMVQNINIMPIISTQYIVTIRNTTGCSKIDTVNVTVNNNLSVNAGIDVTVCKGQKVTLSANANNPTFFRWNTGSLKQTITVAPAQTTTYTVTIKSGDCSGTDNVIVNIVNCKNLEEDEEKSSIDNSPLSINVFPNPSYDGKVYIETIGLESNVKLKVMSYTGATLLEQEINKNDNKHSLDLSNLSNGIFFIKIETLNDVKSFKIILER